MIRRLGNDFQSLRKTTANWRSIPGRADADAGCQLGEVPAIDVAEKRAILAGLSETSRSGREPVAPP